MTKPSISVVVCTHNNAEYLKKALASLREQDLPAGEYEVVVVDNASTDHTAQTCEVHTECTYVFEGRLGLSVARNTGIRAAQGSIVAFIDDDAEAEAGWLSALMSGFEKGDDVWAVGGKALPIWGGPVPEWLTEKHHRSLSLISWGEETRSLEWPERIIGVNCSFRKSVFERFGLFDECLGRIGQALLGHEDTEIQERLHADGKTVMYVPEAVVHHHVPASRMTKEYLARRSNGTLTSEKILELRKDCRDEAANSLATDVRDEQVLSLKGQCTS